MFVCIYMIKVRQILPIYVQIKTCIKIYDQNKIIRFI